MNANGHTDFQSASLITVFVRRRCRAQEGQGYDLPYPLPFPSSGHRASHCLLCCSASSIFPRDPENTSLTGSLGGLKVALRGSAGYLCDIPSVARTWHLHWECHGHGNCWAPGCFGAGFFLKILHLVFSGTLSPPLTEAFLFPEEVRIREPLLLGNSQAEQDLKKTGTSCLCRSLQQRGSF